jgi:plasmid stabilization system protein ParE
VATIVWTLEAARCLEEIRNSVLNDSPAAAHGLVKGIYNKIQMLRKQPRLGQRYESITDREIRITSYGHYRIVYLLRNERRVEILGILHGAMDIDRYLR